jgi:mRNA interferase MazF
LEVIARGDIVVAAQRGPLTSKPRPVLVIQNDAAAAEHVLISSCLISTDLVGAGLFRLAIAPTPDNGLADVSEIQVDQIHTFRRTSIAKRIGHLSPDDMVRVDEALRRWLSL